MNFTDPKWQGSMRVRLDFGNMMAEALGPKQGLDRSEIDALKPALAQADRACKAARVEGRQPFWDLPYQKVDDLLAVAKAVHGRFDDLVLVGTGSLVLHEALTHPYHNLLPAKQRKGLPRVFLAGAGDPDHLSGLLDVLNLKKTLVLVADGPGGTDATLAQFMLLCDRLAKAVGRKNLARHIIIAAGQGPGTLRRAAETQGFVSFTLPEGAGHGFSLLTPAGLLPAAVSGIDIRELLAGAAAMDKACRDADPWKNMAMLLTALLHCADVGHRKPVRILAPCSSRLAGLAGWASRLWADSHGKAKTRRGRVAAGGPTCLADPGGRASLDGSPDKVLVFIRLGQFSRGLGVPKALPGLDSPGHLLGHDLGELYNAGHAGAEMALTLAQRSNCSLLVPAVNAFTLGQLVYCFGSVAALGAELRDLDAADRPGEALAQTLAGALMGRKGSEELRRQVDARGAKNPRWVF